MFTQCPQCETVFRLGAGDLRRAQGRVRCGECNTVFNALDYLQEDDAPVVPAPQPTWLTDSGHNPAGDLEPEADSDIDAAGAELAPEDTEVGSHTEPTFDADEDAAADAAWGRMTAAGEWDFDADDDDEASAHGILVLDDGDDRDAGPAADPDAAAPGDGDPDPADWQREADNFDPSIWERIPGVGALSDEARPVPPEDWVPESDTDDAIPAGPAAADAAPEAPGPDAPDELEFNVPQEKWGNFFGPVKKADNLAAWRPPQFNPADDAAADTPDEPPFRISGDDEAAESDPDEPHFSISADDELTDMTDNDPDEAAAEPDDDPDELAAPVVHGDPDDAVEPDREPAIAPEPGDTAMAVPPWRAGAAPGTDTGRSRSALWTLGTLLLLVALAAQLVHYNRDQLAAHPQYGEQLRAVYARLPFDLYPYWPLSAYEVRGSEAVVGESGRDILDIRARIVTTGAQAVGLPLLRVVLRDRWSNPVAARDFEPGDYAPRDSLPADGMLQPGQPQAAHLRIIDPGIGAQGFELELCLPRRHTGLECNSQPFR